MIGESVCKSASYIQWRSPDISKAGPPEQRRPEERGRTWFESLCSSTPYERNSPRVAMTLDAAESQPVLPFNSDVLVRVPSAECRVRSSTRTYSTGVSSEGQDVQLKLPEQGYTTREYLLRSVTRLKSVCPQGLSSAISCQPPASESKAYKNIAPGWHSPLSPGVPQPPPLISIARERSFVKGDPYLRPC